MNAIRLLREVLVRTITAREALCAGDVIEASETLIDLEFDMAACLAQLGDDIVRVTLDDFNTIPGYGRGDTRIEAWCRSYLDAVA